MLNGLVIFCVLALGVPSQPNKAPRNEEARTAQRQPAIVAANGIDEHPCGTSDKKDSASKPPTGNTTIERTHWWIKPDWWLVIIAGLTGMFIGWQGWETRKAADASRDGIRLQEAAFRQWVAVEGWSSNVIRKKDGRTMLGISFTLVNRTGYPLTIKSGGVKFGPDVSNSSKVKENSFLPPNTPHAIEVEFEMSPEQLRKYLKRELWSGVAGNVVYVGILNKTETQQFGGFLISKQGGDPLRLTETIFIPHIGMEPKPAEDSNQQNPN